MKDSLINLVSKLLKNNKIAFDKEELSFQIQSHPSYPSLHAITGVLDHFNIENVAADVPVNKETLAQLPDCFIAQINTEQGKDLIVVDRKKSDYNIYNTDNKKEKNSETDFLKKFTGIIVAVEQSEESAQIKPKSNISKIVAFGIITILASYLVFSKSNSPYPITYLILSVIGIITSIAILKQELGLKTTIGDAFCSSSDEKKDCDAVLTSKGAEIIKGYKLSDLSILYFSGITLLTLSQITNPVYSYTISLLAIPITLYSLYYQYAIVKKWCLLCLSIVAVLWLQAAIPFITNTFINNFVISDFITIGIVASIVWLVWNYVKPLVTDITELKKEKIENVKFKRNYTLFSSLLQKSPQINTEIENSQEIIFGNSKSPLELTIITNPFCGHCKPVHNHIHDILNRYNDNVKVKIRFNVNTENTDNDLFKITNSLLSIYHTKGEQECMKAMDEIYNGEKPDNWLKKWENTFSKLKYIKELEKESAWCKDNAINFTPEILVNGKSFPKEYNRTDLIFFIEELEENTKPLVMV